MPVGIPVIYGRFKRLAMQFKQVLLEAGGALRAYEAGSEIAAEQTYEDEGSFQPIWSDLTVDPGAGSADGGDSSFIAAAMFNLLGADMTAGQDANYLGGVIGAYSITGTRRSTYPTGAVLAQVTDGVTEVHGAVVAYIDGDSETTKAEAMFKVMSQNSTAASGADYGLDLQDAAHDGFNAVDADFYKKAPVRIVTDVVILVGAGAPQNGVTGDDVAGKGSLYVDTTNGVLYINTGTLADSTWVIVGTQS